jgi:DNA repair ATPase RecN
MDTDLQTLKEDVLNLDKKVDKVLAALTGDSYGNEGLIEKYKDLKAEVKRLDEKIEERVAQRVQQVNDLKELINAKHSLAMEKNEMVVRKISIYGGGIAVIAFVLPIVVGVILHFWK